MVGAIVGDVVGSRFEFNNHKSKEFELFSPECFVTDDSIMTVAVMRAITMAKKGDYADLRKKTIRYMQKYGQRYPDAGYGRRFANWIWSKDPKPYYSYGNGAAMRVSPVAYAARDLGEVVTMARSVTEVTHNHPEGIKGATVVAICIWMALHGHSKEDIRAYASRCYDISFTLDEIREEFGFHESCQKTVPQAIVAFLESKSFEDAIRNAISIGGDSDTIAAITGSIAEAYYGVPAEIRAEALSFVPTKLRYVIAEFEKNV